jgi:hypothetical protein
MFSEIVRSTAASIRTVAGFLAARRFGFGTVALALFAGDVESEPVALGAVGQWD